jgi:hypothetical protein
MPTIDIIYWYFHRKKKDRFPTPNKKGVAFLPLKYSRECLFAKAPQNCHLVQVEKNLSLTD